MKKIWSGIRSIINISKVKANFILSILESGKTVDNPFLCGIFPNKLKLAKVTPAF